MTNILMYNKEDKMFGKDVSLGSIRQMNINHLILNEFINTG